MENEFTEVMSERTDDELIIIVTVERVNYNPIAIKAADVEVEKRNINTSKFEKIRDKAIVEKELKEKISSLSANKKNRFVNFLVDISIIAIFNSSLIYFLGDIEDSFRLIFRTGLAFSLGYYAFMESVFQKTLGKFLTKTKVVDENGDKPSGKQIFTRTLCRLIPFDPLTFLFERKGYKFHDSLSKTMVIKDC
ncbi:RDD family protein [Euzebyella marina]|uniref:RDD family protein n=1 Tax=Euzebyella marina TaxID=1761453 RepID=A0A3G2L5G3_9FLAO|nr:RDD family protein [Euzebyella marina]AYN67483.1 RDD family protein [Euzebyella marina]